MEQYLPESTALDEGNSTIFTTCAESAIHAINMTDLSLNADVGVRAVNVVLADVIFILGNFLNILTLILIVKYKELHSLSFAIAAQITICNTITATTFGFPAVISNILGRWTLGAYVCVICAFFRHLCSAVRGILYFTFAFDRVNVVFFPFSYPRYSQRIVITMCILCWSLSLLVSLIPIPPLLDCYGLIKVRKDCLLNPRCSKNCQTFVRMWVFLIYFPFSFLAIGLYAVLYLKGRKIRRKEMKMIDRSHQTISDSDWRALKTILILFSSFLSTSFFPLILTVIIEQAKGVDISFILVLMGILVHMVIVMDPIIILRNADARRACTRLASTLKQNACLHLRKCKQRLLNKDKTTSNIS